MKPLMTPSIRVRGTLSGEISPAAGPSYTDSARRY
jgi:hypothetical protein